MVVCQMFGEVSSSKIKRYSGMESRAVRKLQQVSLILVFLPVLLLLCLFVLSKNGELSWAGFVIFIVLYSPLALFITRFILKKTSDSFDEIILALADLVHESSTPLSNIHSAIQNISKEKGALESAELQEIQITCDRLLSLHQDLRVISMWGAPLKRSELSVLPPALLISSCKKQLTRSFASREMDLEFHDEGGPSIIADASAIKRVLLNLLENSLKYSEHGSKIVVTTKAHKDGLLVNLRDYGPGIPETLLTRVFDRNFRNNEQEKTTDKPGSGLGLAIVKEIVESHSGTIHVKSLAPKGVEFSVFLPKVPQKHPFVQMFKHHE